MTEARLRRQLNSSTSRPSFMILGYDFISKPFSDNGLKLTKIIQGELSKSETEPEPRPMSPKWLSSPPHTSNHLNIPESSPAGIWRFIRIGSLWLETPFCLPNVRLGSYESSMSSTSVRVWGPGWPRVAQNRLLAKRNLTVAILGL